MRSRKFVIFFFDLPAGDGSGFGIWGRPDDGHAIQTGFFNCEFYVGLKPYKDKVWDQVPIRNKAELTEDLQKKLASYPGVIFNYTQPAEDAVDEALTGLKSARRENLRERTRAGPGKQSRRD